MELRPDLTYTLRSLGRRRVFAAVVVLTLALGVGAATAIYTVVWWQLFRTVAAPPNVALVAIRSPDAKATPFVPSLFVNALSAPNAAIERCALTTSESRNVIVDRLPVASGVDKVTAGFFELMGVRPALGRLFRPEEYASGKDKVVVVAYRFWHENLGGRPDAIGRRIRVGRELCDVVGVLPEGPRFSSYSSGEVYVPFTFRYDPAAPFSVWPVMYAQLRPGVTLAAATAVVSTLKPDLPPQFHSFNPGTPQVISVTEGERLFNSDAYLALVGAVGFLFVIAVINAANLMLGQLVGRRRELAVRLALGSSRAGIVRLAVLESVVLALAGTGAGALCANWLTPVFFFMAGRQDAGEKLLSWHLQSGSFVVLALLTLVTVVATSVAPALLMARAQAQEGLRVAAGAGGESPALRRVRSAFVVTQTALAVMLLVGTGLMIRTVERIAHLPLGFAPEHRVRVRINFPDRQSLAQLPSEQRLAPFERLRQALLRVPGADSAAMSSANELVGYDGVTTTIEGRAGAELKVAEVFASAEFAQVGGLNLLAGNWFGATAKGDVAINETLARSLFPGQNPVGQYLHWPPGDGQKASRGARIVGVVADVREQVHQPPSPTLYLPIAGNLWSIDTLLVKFLPVPGEAEFSRIRSAIFAENPEVIVYDVWPMAKALDQITYNEHLTLSVFKVLSGIALALTLVGLFSIIAYSVDRRMGEFAIRMALGATPGGLCRGILRRAVVLTGGGVLIGCLGAYELTRYIQSVLYDSPAFDGLVTGAIAGLLVITAILACLPAALRASRPDLSSLLKQVD